MADDPAAMAWVRFSKDHDHRDGARTTAYRANMRCLVTRACADEAVKLQRAAEVPAPNRATAERLAQDPFAADLPDPAPPAGAAAASAGAPAAQAVPAPAAASGAPAGSPGQSA